MKMDFSLPENDSCHNYKNDSKLDDGCLELNTKELITNGEPLCTDNLLNLNIIKRKDITSATKNINLIETYPKQDELQVIIDDRVICTDNLLNLNITKRIYSIITCKNESPNPKKIKLNELENNERTGPHTPSYPPPIGEDEDLQIIAIQNRMDKKDEPLLYSVDHNGNNSDSNSDAEELLRHKLENAIEPHPPNKHIAHKTKEEGEEGFCNSQTDKEDLHKKKNKSYKKRNANGSGHPNERSSSKVMCRFCHRCFSCQRLLDTHLKKGCFRYSPPSGTDYNGNKGREVKISIY